MFLVSVRLKWLLAGICEKLKVSEIIGNTLSKSNGRQPDIPY